MLYYQGQLLFGGFPAGLAEKVVGAQRIEAGGEGAFALLFAADGRMRRHDGRRREQKGISAACGHTVSSFMGLILSAFCGILGFRQVDAIFAPSPAYSGQGAVLSKQPADAAIEHRRQRAVDDDRPGDEEHLRAGAQHPALGLELDGRTDHRIGEACDGHEGARARLRGQLLVEAQRRQQGRQHYQCAAGEGAGQFFIQPHGQIPPPQHLAQQADAAAHAERPEAVSAQRRGRADPAHPAPVFLSRHFHPVRLPGIGCPPLWKNIHTQPERRSFMNPSTPHPQRRRLTRAELRRRRRRRAIRRVAGLTLMLCVAAGGVSFLLTRRAAIPSASAASAAPLPAQSAPQEAAASSVPENTAPSNALGLTADEARALLADPLMVLVNHTNKMPDDYTFDTKECGSATAVNKTLQTAACDAFLAMQKAAAADGVTVWMQSGYRSVKYQTSLYEKKTQYYLNKGYDNAAAKEKAAAVVNPPGYSEHNCGLAADLNSPEHTGLDEGFENTAAFRWLCAHAGDYGFILRYPKDAEDKTEIIYEPWHWRYVGVENAARINASGLCFEEYIQTLRDIAAEG